jgi:tRNA A37 threonylcarbamoyladenosine modification protein TsaB
VTTAKSLCYALNLPLVAIDSLAAIAAACLHTHRGIESLCVAIDAYRGQAFAASFTRHDLLPPLDAVPANWAVGISRARVFSDSQWQTQLRSLPDGIAFAGDDRPLGEFAANRVQRECDAVGLGLLGIRAAAIGAFLDPMTLVPRYLRASAAEEKAAASQNNDT